MANILERYGIKEVADVTFYEIGSNGKPTHPVLYLDTLKVSTIEQTAEEAEARGGKGNPPLIIWDYGKEITVTLEDALFSAKSMAIMFGNGTIDEYSGRIMKTISFTMGDKAPTKWEGPDGKLYTMVNPKYYDVKGENVAAEDLTPDEPYFCTFDVEADGAVIEISANSFPGAYYVTGDTYARSEVTGKDEFFQFIIGKAKVQSENTITMEADGDPSVFNMSLRVMRPADGKMMKLVKYTVNGNGEVADNDVVVIHNHDLKGENAPEAQG